MSIGENNTPYACLSRSGTRYVSAAWWNAEIGNLNSFVSCVGSIGLRYQGRDRNGAYPDNVVEINGFVTVNVDLVVDLSAMLYGL
jgi:hypothetical protein